METLSREASSKEAFPRKASSRKTSTIEAFWGNDYTMLDYTILYTMYAIVYYEYQCAIISGGVPQFIATCRLLMSGGKPPSCNLFGDQPISRAQCDMHSSLILVGKRITGHSGERKFRSGSTTNASQFSSFLEIEGGGTTYK